MTDWLSDPTFYVMAVMSTVGLALLILLYRRPRGGDGEEEERGGPATRLKAPPLTGDFDSKLSLLAWADQVVCPSCGNLVKTWDGSEIVRRIIPLGQEDIAIEIVHTKCGAPLLTNRQTASHQFTAEVLSSQYRKTGENAEAQPQQQAQGEDRRPEAQPAAQQSQPASPYPRLRMMPRQELERHIWTCGSCPYLNSLERSCGAADKSGRNYKIWRTTVACSWWLKERIIRYIENGVLEIVEG